ncbi:MAG: hypothetical protein IPH72_25755 [Sandaracinaceae bacterium]|nr:hypothetical protein [Sandaracinaceae bacterium]
MNVTTCACKSAPWNAVGVAQQRIHTEASRAWDNRPAPTPTINRSGHGTAATASVGATILELNEGVSRACTERRGPSRLSVLAESRPPLTVGGTAGAAPPTPTAPSAAGPAQPSPGTRHRGRPGRAGERGRARATGRLPAVDEGPAATLATARERPRDDTDSEQPTQLMQSW